MLRAAFVINLFITICTVATCFPLQNPSYPIERVENKTLVVEHVYNYVVRYYRQPLLLDVVGRSSLDFSSPEKALSAIVSGMINRDIPWVLSCYDSESKAKLESMVSDPQVAQSLIDQWEATYSGSKAYLIRWIDTEMVIILEYSILKNDGTETKNTLNFALFDNQWKATNIYSEYPVSNYLDKDIIRIHGQ